ncbi:OTU domain-containing protein [Endozoicomonas arenosclerae]|uniref:OTU domain-containing protein n=1 Tax=Endozoicomonas arenosclerae TaxID=1633495 RepID=UPI0012946DC8|nr:OTU domain-containing protein [Endozoicomonas arenosclerae]
MQSQGSIEPLLKLAWRLVVSASESIRKCFSCCCTGSSEKDRKGNYVRVPNCEPESPVEESNAPQPTKQNHRSAASQRLLTIHNPKNYHQQLTLLLSNNQHSLGDTPKDGNCFYHAVWSLTNIGMESLQQTMTALLSSSEDEQIIAAQAIIQTHLGEDVSGFVLECIEQNQWGELSFLPVLVQALNIIQGDQFQGIAVITPDNSLNSEPLITIYHPNGDTTITTEFPAHLPILIHETAIHWTFAEADSQTPEGTLDHPSAPISETTPHDIGPTPGSGRSVCIYPSACGQNVYKEMFYPGWGDKPPSSIYLFD